MPAKRKNRRRSTDMVVPAPHSQAESVSIRQISNGYIIERSEVKRGRYVTHQEYSAGRPVISAAAPPPAKTTPVSRPKARPRTEHREVGYLRQSD